jgi:hypothetical protein
VRGLASGPHSGHTNLRVLLVADILHRVVKDLHAGHVQLAVAGASTATETDDRLRLALAFTPEMFGIRPSLAVGDCLDPAAVLFGQRYDVIVERSAGARASSPHIGESNGPLTAATIDQAEQTLREWRRSVAAWAEHPSAPMHRATVESARAALDDNLDVRTVLGLLHQLIENPAVPPGAKFETFVFLDQVLALDLARNVGQPLSER